MHVMGSICDFTVHVTPPSPSSLPSMGAVGPGCAEQIQTLSEPTTAAVQLLLLCRCMFCIGYTAFFTITGPVKNCPPSSADLLSWFSPHVLYNITSDYTTLIYWSCRLIKAHLLPSICQPVSASFFLHLIWLSLSTLCSLWCLTSHPVYWWMYWP